MSYFNNIILFGGVQLEIVNMSNTKVQKSIKQRIGKSISQINIIGVTQYQWVLDINGIISEEDIDVVRQSLEALDNAESHTLIDGVHDGEYYIEPGSLSFTDVGGETINMYRYDMRLIEV